MLHVDVVFKTFNENNEEYVDIQKPIKQAYLSGNYFERAKKNVLLLFPGDTSVGQELGKKICVSVSFCDTALALKKN